MIRHLFIQCIPTQKDLLYPTMMFLILLLLLQGDMEVLSSEIYIQQCTCEIAMRLLMVHRFFSTNETTNGDKNETQSIDYSNSTTLCALGYAIGHTCNKFIEGSGSMHMQWNCFGGY